VVVTIRLDRPVRGRIGAVPGDKRRADGVLLHVRAARAGDAGAIGALQLRAWRRGYADRLPPGALAALTADGLATQWGAAIAAPPTARHRVLVAMQDVEVAGFAALAPAADPDLAEHAAVELLILAVDPDAQRQGHGSRLLNAAMDHARGDGAALAVTWALASDEALRAFLLGSGWGPDGAWRDLADPSGGTIRQVRLHTALADPAPAEGATPDPGDAPARP
jgi:GNAT superfamily N-acetyltransferase